jgi:hypothetical protein
MFKKSWFKNKVTSDEGFSVELVTFNKLIYREGPEYISCFVEPLNNKNGLGDLLLDILSLKNEQSNILVLEPRKTIIINRIVDSLAYMGIQALRSC